MREPERSGGGTAEKAHEGIHDSRVLNCEKMTISPNFLTFTYSTVSRKLTHMVDKTFFCNTKKRLMVNIVI